MSIKRTIKVKEIVEDLLSGITDLGLMVKHGVTAHELDSLFTYLVDSGLVAMSLLAISDSQIARAFVEARGEVKELNRERHQLPTREPSPGGPWGDSRQRDTKRVIRAAEVVRDIRLKMTDLEIMQKYRLSRRGLQGLLKKLFDAGLISSEEMHWRPTEYDDSLVVDLDQLD